MSIFLFFYVGCNAYPDIVEGVSRISRVINETVSAIISFRKRDAQLRVNVLHKLPAIMHCLKKINVTFKYDIISK